MISTCDSWTAAVDTRKDFQYGDIFSLKDEFIERLKPADIQALKHLAVIYDSARRKKPHAAPLRFTVGLRSNSRIQHVSASARRALKALMQYHHAYRSAFPDPTETEPLAVILEYLVDRDRQWDVMVMVNEYGMPIAAASGQLLQVKMAGSIRRILWNEHTWVEPQARGSGCGAAIFRALEDRFLPSLTVIEIDNPFFVGSSTAHNRAPSTDVACAMQQHHTAGASIRRLHFWSRLGFEMVSVPNRRKVAVPFPYTQISMDPTSGQRPCESLFIACRVLAPELRTMLQTSDMTNLYHAMQASVDPAYEEFPSFQSTMKHIRRVAKQVSLLSIISEQSINALAANILEKTPYLLPAKQVDQPRGRYGLAA